MDAIDVIDKLMETVVAGRNDENYIIKISPIKVKFTIFLCSSYDLSINERHEYVSHIGRAFCPHRETYKLTIQGTIKLKDVEEEDELEEIDDEVRWN